MSVLVFRKNTPKYLEVERYNNRNLLPNDERNISSVYTEEVEMIKHVWQNDDNWITWVKGIQEFFALFLQLFSYFTLISKLKL